MSARGLAYKDIDELAVYSGAPTSSDQIPILDASVDEVARVAATKVAIQGAAAFSGVPATSDTIPIWDNTGSAFLELDATLVPVQGAAAFSGAPAADDELLVWDESNSGYRTVGLQDIAINQAFGTDIYANANLKFHLVTATLAEINAGHELLTGVASTTIHVVDVVAVVSGNFADGTDVRLQDEQGSPVVALTYAVAALSDGAILRTSAANVTEGAGFLVGLTAGDGLFVDKTGSDFTGGTSITFGITYATITA